MRKISLFIVMSLDGYIADSKGNVDWLEGQGSEPFPNPIRAGIRLSHSRWTDAQSQASMLPCRLYGTLP